MNLNFYSVDTLCAGVDFDSDRPVIDLSDIDFFEPFALVYLGMVLRHFTSSGRVIQVIPPVDRKALGYLARQNFWQRFNFDPATLNPALLWRLSPYTSLNDIVDIERRPNIAEEILFEVLKVLRNNGLNLDAQTLAEVTAELVDNFAVHSEEGRYGALAMQWYPQGHRLILAVGDCGIGIRRSLSKAGQYAYLANRSHGEATTKAFEAEVTSRSGHGGIGLSEVVEGIARMGGQVQLVSGNSFIRISSREERRTGSRKFEAPGVQIEISVPVR
ncbi:MAG: ATP-binding protein [Candidatus Binatus sp.]